MKRRSVRIGLVTSLVFTVVIFAFLAWLVPQRSLRQREGKVMAQLTAQGWGFSYYDGWDENDSTWIEKRLDTWFGRRVRSVTRNRSDVDDLTILKQIANLQEVLITNSQIEDLTPLSEIASLKVIELTGSGVDDLTTLQNLTNLTYLYACRTPVPSVQIEQLSKAIPHCIIFHPSAETR